jgi:hypothetical protein
VFVCVCRRRERKRTGCLDRVLPFSWDDALDATTPSRVEVGDYNKREKRMTTIEGLRVGIAI